MITDQNIDIIQVCQGYLYESRSQSTGWIACVVSVSLEQRAAERGFWRFALAKNGARAERRKEKCRG